VRLPVFVDESGFYLLPSVVRTYAPCGEPPVLKVAQTNDHLSMMSGITPRGDLLTLTRSHALRGQESVAFLQHAQLQLGRRLLVIWDRSPIHRSEQVRQFLAQGAAQAIHLELLPPYAPDLNPDEGVWRLYKQDELPNLCCEGLNVLHQELRLATLRLRHRPESIQSCFKAAGLDL
jgi:transposase